MGLSRENMEKYSKLENEINRINRKLDYYAKNPIGGSHGVVKGSMGGFPYAECHFVVGAPDIKRRFYFLKPELQSEEYKAAMEELCMLTQVGKNEHEDSADGLVQLLQLIDGCGVAKTTIINSPF